MTRENSDVGDIVDIIETGIDLFEENRDTIEELVGSSNEVKLGQDSPLTSAQMDEDYVYVTVEAKKDDIDGIKVKETEDGVVLGINGDPVSVDAPDDVNTAGVEAQLNNGVLEVKIPRTGGE